MDEIVLTAQVEALKADLTKLDAEAQRSVSPKRLAQLRTDKVYELEGIQRL